MFGAFRPSSVNLGGLLWCGNSCEFLYDITNVFHRKVPWKLSRTRKANVRSRLKKVDTVIEAVRASGIQCAALVSVMRLPYIFLCHNFASDAGKSSGASEGTRDASP